EWLSTNTSTPLEMVGVRDSFGQSGGSSELMDLMGLNEAGICEAARRAISRK
ncbi:MAG TPA: transketolase family protein, partial [Candidatus Poseidoniales archaeon]